MNCNKNPLDNCWGFSYTFQTTAIMGVTLVNNPRRILCLHALHLEGYASFHHK